MSAQMAADFRRAAGLIREKGHIKRSYGNPEIGFCTVGALAYSCELGEHVKVLGGMLGGSTAMVCPCGCGAMGSRPDNFTAVTNWNDRPETTAEDVITLLEQAAEKLEADA